MALREGENENPESKVIRPCLSGFIRGIIKQSGSPIGTGAGIREALKTSLQTPITFDQALLRM
jgi:hypothetical protein